MLLDEKDFTFTVLNQHRTDGTFGISGEILLADSGQEKYAVKHILRIYLTIQSPHY